MRLIRKYAILLFAFLLFVIGYYAFRYWPVFYEIAHGEMRCFTKNSTRLDIRHMLFSFHDLMTKENLTYWIDYGTLLGSTRIGGLIPYDYDADVGYLLKDMSKIGRLVAPALHRRYGVSLDAVLPVQMRYRGAGVDLFAYGTYRELGRPIPNGKTNETLTRAFYRVSEWFEQTYSDTNPADLFPTRKCPFESGWLMCPNRPGAVLSVRYPYTYSYRLNVRIPFKLKCYSDIFDLLRILFHGE